MKPGSYVECIDDVGAPYIKKGNIYTILEIFRTGEINSNGLINGGPFETVDGCTLVEIDYPDWEIGHGMRIAYRVNRFREIEPASSKAIMELLEEPQLI